MNRYIEALEKRANKLTRYISENSERFPAERMKDLYQKGYVKGPLHYAHGGNRLLKKITDKHGVKLDRSIAEPMFMGPANTVAGKVRGVSKAHEMFEAEEFNSTVPNKTKTFFRKYLPKDLSVKNLIDEEFSPKQVTRLSRMGKVIDSGRAPGYKATPIVRRTYREEKPVGMHHNLAVLGRESNYLRSNPWSHIQKPFRGHDSIPFEIKDLTMAEARHSSGEAGLLESITKKRFGVDKYTIKDLHKLRNAPTEETLRYGKAYLYRG